MMTSTRKQEVRVGKRALRELVDGSELEAVWHVAYETADDSGVTTLYRVWFEKRDRSDSFGVSAVVSTRASQTETEAAAVEEIKRLVRARNL